MARLYSNENFPLPVVERLRVLGHDVLTIQEAGGAGQAAADEEVLRFATEDGRAGVTLNRRHFVRLHNTEPNHKGIVVCSFDKDFDGQAKRIDEALAAHDSLDGQLVRVNRPG